MIFYVGVKKLSNSAYWKLLPTYLKNPFLPWSMRWFFFYHFFIFRLLHRLLKSLFVIPVIRPLWEQAWLRKIFQMAFGSSTQPKPIP
jgi:hypothetical protein